MHNTALLVVDMQAALCAGPWAAFGIDGVVDGINGAIATARKAGHRVVFVQHEEDEGPLQPGTDGWQLDARLARHPGDRVFAKRVCDAFHAGGLGDELRSHGIDRVAVCGLQSEFCIDSTVRGALAQGFAVALLADAHTTLDNGVLTAAQITAHHNATLGQIGGYGPRVTVIAAADWSLREAPHSPETP